MLHLEASIFGGGRGHKVREATPPPVALFGEFSATSSHFDKFPASTTSTAQVCNLAEDTHPYNQKTQIRCQLLPVLVHAIQIFGHGTLALQRIFATGPFTRLQLRKITSGIVVIWRRRAHPPEAGWKSRVVLCVSYSTMICNSDMATYNKVRSRVLSELFKLIQGCNFGQLSQQCFCRAIQ